DGGALDVGIVSSAEVAGGELVERVVVVVAPAAVHTATRGPCDRLIELVGISRVVDDVAVRQIGALIAVGGPVVELPRVVRIIGCREGPVGSARVVATGDIASKGRPEPPLQPPSRLRVDVGGRS